MNNQYIWIAITAVAFVGGLEIGYAVSMNNDPYIAFTRDPEAMNRFANQLMTSMMNSSQHQQIMNEMMSGHGMGMQSGSMGMNHNMTQGNMGMQSGSMGGMGVYKP